MKINKRMLTGVTAMLAVGTVLAVEVGHDYMVTKGPTIQSPTCSGNGENDNGCTEVTCTPPYYANATSPNNTHQKCVSYGPGGVSVVFTTTQYECKYIPFTDFYWCNDTVVGVPTVSQPTFMKQPNYVAI